MYGDTRVITADQIITMDPARPRAEAVAVSGGRITAVGSIAECLTVTDAPITDLSGSTLMPGFVEPHSHPLLSGITTEAPAYNISPWLVPDWYTSTWLPAFTLARASMMALRRMGGCRVVRSLRSGG